MGMCSRERLRFIRMNYVSGVGGRSGRKVTRAGAVDRSRSDREFLELDKKESVTRMAKNRFVYVVETDRARADGTIQAVLRIVGIGMQFVNDNSRLPEQQGSKA